jgi:hypothetical protein
MTLKRPGTPAASFMKLARPLRMVSQSRPTAHAAATEAITLSTWKPMVPLRVMGTSRSAMRSRHEPSAATSVSWST